MANTQGDDVATYCSTCGGAIVYRVEPRAEHRDRGVLMVVMSCPHCKASLWMPTDRRCVVVGPLVKGEHGR